MNAPSRLPAPSYLVTGEDGLSRLDRRVFTDPAIFEAEIRCIWEKVWVFLAHESQLSKPHDFFSTWIGRQPVLLTRTESGKIAAFINACRHRGSKLCQVQRGNAKLHRCPYHDWVYSSSGQLISIKEESAGGYPDSFDKKTMGLTPVPHVESYRGYIFGSLNPDVMPLKRHLGDATVFIDLLEDQADSWEVLKGSSSYTFDANWKLQAENGVDMYHATTVHFNLMATVQNRAKLAAQEQKKAPEIQLHRGQSESKGGFFNLGNGHVVVWRDWAKPEARYNWGDRDNITRRMGEMRARWAIGRLRNTLIYPNLLLMDLHSTQIRVIRPVAVDKTEVTSYAIAPAGEPAEQRRRRLRAFEDFFNASGMATPDDLEVFRLCQSGFRGETSRWSDISRGARRKIDGPDEHGQELGINARSSGGVDDEGLFVANYGYWAQLLRDGAEV